VFIQRSAEKRRDTHASSIKMHGVTEVRRMDDTNAMIIWNAVSVRITDVRHGYLEIGQMDLTGENSSFLFVSGKDARVIMQDAPYILRANGFFHIGRGHRVVLGAAGKAEYHLVSYQPECMTNGHV